MLFIRKIDYITGDGGKNYQQMELDLDNAEELPNAEYIKEHNMCQGSIAWDISTGDFYALNGSNEWIKQGGE